MPAPKELELLRSVKTGKGLIKLVINLRNKRRENKVKDAKRLALSKKQRESVLAKTNCRCHLCGNKLEQDNFHADHIQSHISGGIHSENNYLPSCSTCNNLRWHYSAEEIQIIMKLGRWLKTKILEDSDEGLLLANEFLKHEMALRKKRK